MKELEKEIVFYDGECGFCSNSVQFILNHERDHDLHFCPLQSDFAANLLAKQGVAINLDTIYVYSKGQIYSKSQAIKIASKHFKNPYSWVSSLISITPRFIADSCYTFFANNRYHIQGKVAQCLLPTPDQRQRFLNLS
jgi:predicted DCC family thiol-disulfide oxidoreductase YuxK